MPPESLRRVPAVIGCLLIVLGAGAVRAEGGSVSRVLDASEQTQRASVSSQKRVDKLADQTQAMLREYRNAVWQAQQLRVYTQQVEALSEAQAGEKEALERQIAEMERVDRELLPLMLRMIDSLESFVKLDLPFLSQERSDRVANLRKMMADPDVGTAERFRRIIEAYRVEVDYGNSLGAERVEIDGRMMDQLRVGRTALFALAPDNEQALRWDADAQRWQPLPGRYIAAVRKGLKIARETAAPSLLVLPVHTATPVEGPSGATP